MINFKKLPSITALLPLSIAVIVSACGSDDEMSAAVDSANSSSAPAVMTMAEYEISITNGSTKQLLAPAAVLLSAQSLDLWVVGMPASAALEQLAESGSPDALMASVSVDDSAALGATPPGSMSTAMLSLPANMPAYVSFAAMPVYTNDGFVGLQNIDVSNLAVGDAMQFMAPVYDAGTEANTESLSTLPGPDVGGEGYSIDRDDIHDYVTRHAGIISNDDGLSSSVLDESYRFDSGSFYLEVTRVK